MRQSLFAKARRVGLSGLFSLRIHGLVYRGTFYEIGKGRDEKGALRRKRRPTRSRRTGVHRLFSGLRLQTLFGFAGGLCGERIFRPGMLGVTTAHFGPYLFVGIGPEMPQIARDLQGPPGRREQVQHDRHAAVRQEWGVGPPEHFLQFYRQNGRFAAQRRQIINLGRGAGRQVQPLGSLLFQAPRQRPGQQGAQGRAQIDGGKLGTPAHPIHPGQKPVRFRFIGQSGG